MNPIELNNRKLEDALVRLRMVAHERSQAKKFGFHVSTKSAGHLNKLLGVGAVDIPGGEACWSDSLQTLFHHSSDRIVGEFEKIHQNTKPTPEKTLISRAQKALLGARSAFQSWVDTQQYFKIWEVMDVSPEAFRAYFEALYLADDPLPKKVHWQILCGEEIGSRLATGWDIPIHVAMGGVTAVSQIRDFLWDKGSTPEVLDQAFSILTVREIHE
jgi:hypothetical protein